MTTKYFLGLPKAEFIWHGEWADFEIIYEDHSCNGNEIQEIVWEDYQQDLESKDFILGSNETEDDGFGRWAKECPDRVYGILEDYIMLGNEYGK